MEAAGLVIGVVGLAGLFSVCIESLDIVVNIQHFSEDFDLLCAQLALQRVRLLLWGESLGLVPSPSGKSIPYNHGIDRSDIRPAIQNALNQIYLLLQKADIVTDEYELKGSSEDIQTQTQSPHGLMIFRATFEAFKLKLRKNQKQKSNWALTKWSVHDYGRFKDLIERLRGLIDSLEDITNALGVLGQQHARLAQEIESISDTRSLRLLQDVSSSNASSRASRLVADTASHRLQLFGGSSRSDGWSSIYKETTSSQSYYTARSIIDANSNSGNNPDQHTPEFAAVEEGQKRELVIRRQVNDHDVSRDFFAQNRSKIVAFYKSVSSKPATDPAVKNSARKTKAIQTISTIIDTPQNQRMMAEITRTAKFTPHKHEPSFQSEAKAYGNALSAVRATDEELWLGGSQPLLTQANNSVSIAQHVFLELRSIRRAAVPFISASPVKDQLDRVLASIEGPLDTPYAGGIFWISVRFVKAGHPPLLRFQTRILHPNVDCTGKVCADYKAWWEDPKVSRYVRGTQSTYGSPWFSSRNSNYSLGMVLTALCGLLASPNIEDPLVPEVAEMYLKDYDGYCKAAKMYTERYAGGLRPDEEQIVYADEEDVDRPSQAYHTAQSRAHASSTVRGLASTVGSEDKQEDMAEDQGNIELSRHSDSEGDEHEEEEKEIDTEWFATMSGTGFERGSRWKRIFGPLP